MFAKYDAESFTDCVIEWFYELVDFLSRSRIGNFNEFCNVKF